jgi:multidrug efflux pump subunit AcrA (membrane-fusion protein)
VSVTAAVAGDLGVALSGLVMVTPLATVSVKSEINGKLVEIGAQEGQMARAGDFFAEIDPRPYQNALHQAQGQLMRDQALLECHSACNFGSDSYVERPDRQGVCGGLIHSRRCSHMSGLLMRAFDRWP